MDNKGNELKLATMDRFVTDCCILSMEYMDRVSVTDVYQVYVEWAKRTNSVVYLPNALSKKLRSAGFERCVFNCKDLETGRWMCKKAWARMILKTDEGEQTL